MTLLNWKCLFVLVYLLLISSHYAQTHKLRFEHLTVEDGLTSNSITHIFQDSKGFLWISTQDGFNRYDGYDFKHYKHVPGDLNSLSDYAVNHIFEDSKGLFWISTREGLNLFNPKTEKFRQFKPDSTNPNSISSEKIFQVAEDKSGNIWIATRNGLNVFNPKTDEFKVFLKDDSQKNSISSNTITAICFDSKGTLWVGTLNGLNRFNSNTNSFEVFLNNKLDSGSIAGNVIGYIFEDSKENLWVGTNSGLSKLKNTKDGSVQFENFLHNPEEMHSVSPYRVRIIDEDAKSNLWIGTIGGGLSIYNFQTNRFTHHKYSPHDNSSLSDDEIMALYVDNFDNVWVGSPNSGISKYSPTYERFNLFHPDNHSDKQTETNNISAILIDNKSRLWLGTKGGGVKVYDINSFNRIGNPLFELNSYVKGGLSSNKISCILQDKEGLIWIGTSGKGLNRYNPETNRIEVFSYDKENLSSLSNNYVHIIFEDSEGKIWVGTGLGGVNRFDKTNNTFKRYSNSPPLQNHPGFLNSSEVTAILEDSEGFLWFGTTTGGLSKFDRKLETFTHYKHVHSDEKSISSNRIVCIYEDKKKRLWIGTFSGGLNLFNKESNSFEHFLEQDGLPANNIMSIGEDDLGNLWFASSNGISKFDFEKKEIKNFDLSDGLQGKEFNPNSYCKDKNTGVHYFGGTKGLNIYNSNSIIEKTDRVEVVLTDFKVFNKSVMPGEDSLISVSIPFAEIINLSYDQDVISFSFAAMDFTSPEKNQYAYKLEGFDRDWIYSGNNREVTYTNLNSGNYIFKVKATNSDGIWNETGTQIGLTINPPFWRTWWATLFYIIIASLGIYTIRKYEMNRIKLRNELRLREFESKKLQEVDQIKSRFFANLSHEFRTPLMLIKGPIEQMEENTNSEEEKTKLKMVSKNIHNLQSLIDQLLELSQLEAAAIPIKAVNLNLVSALKGLISSFNSLAEQRNILLHFETEIRNLDVWADPDKLEKIVNNLLSNAIKFTKAGGRILVNLKIEKTDNTEFAQIKISDTGTGIAEDKLHKIFDRFYQVDDSTNKEFSGSGIGLALVKELVDLHRWKISVQSKLNIGTEFTINIPLWEYLDTDQKLKGKESIRELIIEPEPDYKIYDTTNDNVRNKIVKTNGKKRSILIVEDSEDVRFYLSDLLKKEYEIIEAENGIKGIESAIQNSPDIIISDIMMPVMDGIEFCRKIKTAWETSHIPVILLTAKVSHDSKLEGLETGADDYLFKPFEIKELFIRIRNLLDQRNRLKEKYSKEIKISPEIISTNSVDNEFLTKAFDIAEKNLSNPDFNAEDLAIELNMSLSKFRRKLLALTGESPGEFLRTYRLKRAAQMLIEKKFSVTQIAFEVGFNSPSHFSKAFQQHFGCLPSEFNQKLS